MSISRDSQKLQVPRPKRNGYSTLRGFRKLVACQQSHTHPTFDHFLTRLSLTTNPLRDCLKERLPRSVTYTKRELIIRNEEYMRRDTPEEVSPSVEN